MLLSACAAMCWISLYRLRFRFSACGRDYGLVTEVVPAESLLDRANALADELMAASPSSLTRAKHLLTSSAAAGIDHDLERAILENARIRCTPDFKEGVASFLEKRKPIWQEPD